MQETQETRLDPWVRKIPPGGNGNPLQYSCLENPWTEDENQSLLRTQKEGNDVLRTTNDQGTPSNSIHSCFMLPPCISNHLHCHRMKEKRGQLSSFFPLSTFLLSCKSKAESVGRMWMNQEANHLGTALVAQWLRPFAPNEGTWVRSLSGD